MSARALLFDCCDRRGRFIWHGIHQAGVHLVHVPFARHQLLDGFGLQLRPGRVLGQSSDRLARHLRLGHCRIFAGRSHIWTDYGILRWLSFGLGLSGLRLECDLSCFGLARSAGQLGICLLLGRLQVSGIWLWTFVYCCLLYAYLIC